MAAIYDLAWDEASEEHLWKHGLYPEDAYGVLDEALYKVFPDNPHPQRLKMIGPGRGGALLTIIIEGPNDRGVFRIVTGWHSDKHETTLYDHPGGTQHA